MTDGSIRRVGYDSNGHVYYPIGRYLIETGEVARVSTRRSDRGWMPIDRQNGL